MHIMLWYFKFSGIDIYKFFPCTFLFQFQTFPLHSLATEECLPVSAITLFSPQKLQKPTLCMYVALTMVVLRFDQ